MELTKVLLESIGGLHEVLSESRELSCESWTEE